MALPRAVHEFCKHRTIELSATDMSVATIADVFGVTTSTICRWRKEGMPDVTSARNSVGGRPRKLNNSQLSELETLLSQGATAHGWPNELWTTKRMAKLIRQRFNVTCNPQQAWVNVTQYLGWTSQKPIQQLRAADEDETNRWLAEDYPRIVAR